MFRFLPVSRIRSPLLRLFSGKSSSRRVFEYLSNLIEEEGPVDMKKEVADLDLLNARAERMQGKYTVADYPARRVLESIQEHMEGEVEETVPQERRFANIAIIGTPNSGKSTLMNALVGEHISAVSSKVNTTHRSALGVYTDDYTQLFFHDTPGIVPLSPKKIPNKVFTRESWHAIQGADAGIIIMDAARTFSQYDYYLFQRLIKLDFPEDFKLALVLNKTDRVSPKRLLVPLAEKLKSLINFDDIFMISALNNEGVDELRDYLIHECSKPGDWEVEKGQTTDLSDEDRVEEVVKEAVYTRFNQELPYTIEIRAKPIEKTYRDEKTALVECSVFVQNKRHQSYIVGKEGKSIKQIVSHAKPLIEKFLNRPVQLQINVLLYYKS